MLYDFRELIFKDIISIPEGDANYYFKRFKKAMQLLNDSECDQLMGMLEDFKSRYGLSGYSLRDLELRMQGKMGLKVRSENNIKIVSVRKLYLELANIDDWLDSKIKQKAQNIRFSNPLDGFKPA